MAWYLDGKRIYVEKDSGWIAERRSAFIEPLDSTQTTIHDSGRPSYRRTLQFVVFSGFHENILPLADGTYKPLLSDQGNEGNVYINTFEPERLHDISRETAVFRVTTELIKEGS